MQTRRKSVMDVTTFDMGNAVAMDVTTFGMRNRRRINKVRPTSRQACQTPSLVW
jgi:hypothetical protein